MLSTALACASVRAAEPPAGPAFGGWYAIDGDPRNGLWIDRIAGLTYRLESPGAWEGAGIFDGRVYYGVFRYLGEPGGPGSPALAGAFGTHVATVEPDGSLSVRGQFTRGPVDTFAVRWRSARAPRDEVERRQQSAHPNPAERPAPAVKLGGPVPPPTPATRHVVVAEPPPGAAPGPGGRPAFGEYVYVEELPEAIAKVPPVYPQVAREAGVEGTVLVQALVGEDGLVHDTKITKSIPMLDAAAAECVRQWRFKPALSKGKPVAVWVAVPLRFSLR